MRYDPQSAFIFSRTDWPSLGAVHSPPADVPRFGMPLTVWETQALGSARRSAEGTRLGTATETFVQPHPQHSERGIVLICTAWCHREGGWTIGLVEPDGRDSAWVLKADIEAQLRCACHCEWRPDCPGVVSVDGYPGAGHPPGTLARFERRLPGRDQQASLRAPGAQPLTLAPAAERQGWFGRRHSEAVPAAVPAIVGVDLGHPVGDRSVEVTYSPSEGVIHFTEQDRGSIYTPAQAVADPEPISYADEVLSISAPEPEPVRLARAERRGFFATLFGSRDEPPPAAIGYAPSPDADFSIAYATRVGDAYEYAEPQIADATDYAYAEPLPAPNDVPQLPPPADYQLSTQSEIDSFIAAANAYAEPSAPEPEPERLALPAPEAS